MTTGYTAYIKDGKITTGKDFLLLCTRAFGIAIDLKDEPLDKSTPENFEPDTFYKDLYENALKELQHAQEMTFQEAKDNFVQSYRNRVDIYSKQASVLVATNKKYEKVRKEIESWVPPSNDYINLKEFALKQIDMCMVEQKAIDKYNELAKEKLDCSDSAVRKYMVDTVKQCQDVVNRYKEKWQRELDRSKSKTEWMKKLVESFN